MSKVHYMFHIKLYLIQISSLHLSIETYTHTHTYSTQNPCVCSSLAKLVQVIAKMIYVLHRSKVIYSFFSSYSCEITFWNVHQVQCLYDPFPVFAHIFSFKWYKWYWSKFISYINVACEIWQLMLTVHRHFFSFLIVVCVFSLNVNKLVFPNS